MQQLTKRDKNWLILFALILVGMVAGCMYETMAYHAPIGPRPMIKKTF